MPLDDVVERSAQECANPVIKQSGFNACMLSAITGFLAVGGYFLGSHLPLGSIFAVGAAAGFALEAFRSVRGVSDGKGYLVAVAGLLPAGAYELGEGLLSGSAGLVFGPVKMLTGAGAALLYAICRMQSAAREAAD